MKYVSVIAILFLSVQARAEFQVYASTPTTVTRAILLDRYNKLAIYTNQVSSGTLQIMNDLIELQERYDLLEAQNKGTLEAIDRFSEICSWMPVFPSTTTAAK